MKKIGFIGLGYLGNMSMIYQSSEVVARCTADVTSEICR